MKFIDFFSGIGGIRLGLELAGHECLGFCEWDKYARQSYKAMFNTEGEFESHDVRTINAGDLPRADLWCFGFPCQDISIAGKQKGLENGERSGLFFQVMRLLAGTQEEDKPEWLLAENVRNLLSIGNGFDFLRLLIEMGRVGYDVEWQLLDSKDYGVAQHRERVFIIGHLRSKGGRKIFPVTPADGKNIIELHQIGKLKDANRDNSSRYRVYDSDGLAPTIGTMSGGGLEPCVVEKEIKQIGHIEGYGIDNPQAYRVYDKGGLSPTLIRASDGKVPHIVDDVDVKQIGHGTSKDGKPIQGYGVFDANGLAPTLTTGHGSAQPYVTTNGIVTYNVTQKVKIRKNDIDIPVLQEMLRWSKHISRLTNQEIADEMGVPLTKVEHWFRTDNCFAIPTPDVWEKLKEVLDIKTDKFDAQVMEFIEVDGEYDQSNRVYGTEGIAPTLTRANADIKVVGNYSPSGYNATRVVDSNGIAPTVMENHGQVTAVTVKCVGNKNPSGHGNGGAIYDSDGISPTICCGDKSYTYITCQAVLTPEHEEKRQNGRRMKEDGEPMFTLTTQDRHGVAILKKERTEYGKKIRKAYEAGDIQEQRKNMTQFTPRTDDISNTITTVTKDNYLMVSADETDTDNNAL